MLLEQIRSISLPRKQCWADAVITPRAQRIAHRHCDVAQPALVAYAAYGAAFGEVQKRLLGPGE